MSNETVVEAFPEPTEGVERDEETDMSERHNEDYPFYIVPRPPIPGKTLWSVTPY